MKKYILLLCITLLVPNIIFAASVEIHAINQLDEPRGYCLDIKGYKLKAKINQALQAHTCYSYQGDIAVDQGFDPFKLNNNEFFMPAFDVCMEAASLSESSPLLLIACDNSKHQQFKWDRTGRIQITGENTLCLTIAKGEPQKGGGGSPVHLKRNLTLEPCSNALDPYQIWSARKRN